MSDSQVIVGNLVPCGQNLDCIPIFSGVNSVGRDNLSIRDKRISRKHITLRGSPDDSAEITVEGQNPVILRSGGVQKKMFSPTEKFKIFNGDIIELLPGHYPFKYESPPLSYIDSNLSKKEKRHSCEDSTVIKRYRQDDNNRSFATKNVEKSTDQDATTSLHVSPSKSAEGSNLHEEAIRHFRVSQERLHLIFRLMKVQGLPAWANNSSVTIADVIKGNIAVAILSNYMVDIDWLLSACPEIARVPHVLVVHGESGASVDQFKKSRLSNWMFHKPPLPISYGTHHSKAMFLVYPKGVRIVVHTANLIHVDWNNKTQGLWMQDFPWKDEKNLNKDSFFEKDLVDYLQTLKWPQFNVKLPGVGDVNINPSFFKKFDYGSAQVRLIASVPGYHTGSNLRKWGHMKLRSILENCEFSKEFCKSPLIYQFSSLGSLDEKWLAELAVSMSSGASDDGSTLGIGKPLIIWPTVEDVRCSIEGYAAGNAIPSPQKNVEKEFLKKYWAKWKASHVGRCRAMPHIKTYTRYNGQNLAWFLLTSANLSKAAWGALQKNSSQLMIRSYELGVLFLPSRLEGPPIRFSCTENFPMQDSCKGSNDAGERKIKFTTLCQAANGLSHSSLVIQLPVPYQLPPQPYTSEDVPWSWDRQYSKKDVYGQVWPRHVQLYSNQDT